MTIEDFINKLEFDSNGLMPAIIQDVKTSDVLMLAYMNRESLEKTLNEGKTCFYSRSRQKLWTKGETSGCFQYVKEIFFDCDSDALLIKVNQVGPACHEGYKSCFFRNIKIIPQKTGKVIQIII